MGADKGQIISKGLLVYSNSPKKERTNSFLLLRRICSFVFWENSRRPKSPFEIIWPLEFRYRSFTNWDWPVTTLQPNSLCYQPIDGWWCNPNASRYTSFSINSIIKRDNGLGDEVPSKLRSYFLKCQAWYILWQRVLSNNNVLLITSKETSSWKVTFTYLTEV